MLHYFKFLTDRQRGCGFGFLIHFNDHMMNRDNDDTT